MEETSKYGVLGRHQPCSEERIEVLSDTIERHHSSRNTPSLLYPESFGWKLEKSKTRRYASPRPPPKISLEHDWMKELGSEVAQQAKGSQPTQLNPNPNHDRTVRPVVCPQRKSKHVQFKKKLRITIERGDPLFALSERPKHVSLS